MNAQECSTAPVAALSFNGVATSRIVAAACRACVKQFIYLPTAHVYANPLIWTISEETCPCNLHPYATSHHSRHAVQCKPMKISKVLCKLSNAFDAPTHEYVNCWMLVVNDLCKQVVQNES